MTIRFVSVSISLKFHLIPSHSIEFPSWAIIRDECQLFCIGWWTRWKGKMELIVAWMTTASQYSVLTIRIQYYRHLLALHALSIIRMISKLYFFFQFFFLILFFMLRGMFFLEFFIHSDWLQYFLLFFLPMVAKAVRE